MNITSIKEVYDSVMKMSREDLNRAVITEILKEKIVAETDSEYITQFNRYGKVFAFVTRSRIVKILEAIDKLLFRDHYYKAIGQVVWFTFDVDTPAELAVILLSADWGSREHPPTERIVRCILTGFRVARKDSEFKWLKT